MIKKIAVLVFLLAVAIWLTALFVVAHFTVKFW